MSKGEVSQTIIVIGVLVLVGMTVAMAYISLGEISVPEDDTDIIKGGELRVAGGLAALADKCWRDSGQGSRSQVRDCFTARVFSNASVAEENIAERLESLPKRNFVLKNGPIPDTEVKVKVTYLPVEENVEISLISACRPSEGDTCFSRACSCGTVCAPGFDPDGDGTAETDAKGCLKEYSFEPSYNPCSASSAHSCSDSSIYRSGTVDDGFFIFDIGEKIGLRNVTLIERPSNSFYGLREAESDLKISPREAVGAGSPRRKLFRKKGNISISGLPDQEYAVFVWGCEKSGGVLENCGWLRPFQFDVS